MNFYYNHPFMFYCILNRYYLSNVQIFRQDLHHSWTGSSGRVLYGQHRTLLDGPERKLKNQSEIEEEAE